MAWKNVSKKWRKFEIDKRKIKLFINIDNRWIHLLLLINCFSFTSRITPRERMFVLCNRSDRQDSMIKQNSSAHSLQFSIVGTVIVPVKFPQRINIPKHKCIQMCAVSQFTHLTHICVLCFDYYASFKWNGIFHTKIDLYRYNQYSYLRNTQLRQSISVYSPGRCHFSFPLKSKCQPDPFLDVRILICSFLSYIHIYRTFFYCVQIANIWIRMDSVVRVCAEIT